MYSPNNFLHSYFSALKPTEASLNEIEVPGIISETALEEILEII